MTPRLLEALLPADEPDGVTAWRGGARERLEREGLPHRRIEAWRTTDPAPFLARLAEAGSATASEPSADAWVLNGDGTWAMPRVGRVGLRCRALTEACLEGGAVAAWAEGNVGRGGLADVTRACAFAGGVLEVDGILDEPVRVWRRPAVGTGVLPPLVVVLAPGARVVVEDHGTVSGTVLSAGHAVVGADAELHWVRHTARALGETWWQDSQSFSVEAGARLTVHVAVTGAAWHRQDIAVDLVGEGADFTYRGLIAGPEDAHADVRLELRHLASGTTSRQVHRGLHGRGARGVFTGLVHVAEGIRSVKSDQELRALMLAAGASALCQPQLEILADDVACSHGATVGQLDEDAVFYLRARGLDEAMARALLAAAFARPALEGLSAPSVRAIRSDLAEAGFAEDQA
ncbi:MAG: SufD family Fe-S cluster assembly protein [Candidatus Sericytochromatia bacterium]|nr:SufD family Fe-S cluster assembly protein [Candidatus Sericytochromatia bacterium]